MERSPLRPGPGIRRSCTSGDRLTDSFGAYRVPLIITDAEVETGVRISAGTPAAHAGLLLRCSRYAIGESELCGYYIGLNPDRDCVEIALLDHGYIPLAEQPVRIDNDTFYLLRARLRDSTIEVMLGADPSPLLTVEDATAWVDGAVGLTAYGAAAAFSHLYVTPTIQNYAESWRTYPELGSTPRTLSPLEWRGDGQPVPRQRLFFRLVV